MNLILDALVNSATTLTFGNNLYKFWTATMFEQSVSESSSIWVIFSGETTITVSESMIPALKRFPILFSITILSLLLKFLNTVLNNL